jgi:mRNA interferase YafQ
MRKLIWSNTFVRSFKRTIKKNPTIVKEIEKTLRSIIEDPFLPQLGTHKLKGKLAGTWACSVAYDLRLIFDFVKSESNEEDDIFLLEIGTHDEVY